MAAREPPGTDRDDTAAMFVDFSAAVRTLFAAGGGRETLEELVRLAVATIDGCDFAGISLLDGGADFAPVHTDARAADVDALQHEVGEGPCLDAMERGTLVYAEDLGVDPRWVRFGAPAAAIGVRSVLAVPLVAGRALGALNLYASRPDAFGVLDRARGALLAAMAVAAFTSARTQEAEDERAVNLVAALSTREMIGQAQGILMERERLTADQAFDMLRRASQHLNVKLREVAQALVETGEKPDTGEPAG